MFGRLASNAAPNAIRILKNLFGTGTLRQAAMGFKGAFKAAGGVAGIRQSLGGMYTAGMLEGSTMGGGFRAGMRTAGGVGRDILAANPRIGMGARMGFGSLGKWATGGGGAWTLGRAGRMGARLGGGAAAADFLNPWGLGWGD